MDRNANKEAQDKARQAEIEDFKFIMSDSRGRRFIKRLISRTGVFRLSYNESPGVTAFNEGQRNIGLATLAEVGTHAPEHLNEIMGD